MHTKFSLEHSLYLLEEAQKTHIIYVAPIFLLWGRRSHCQPRFLCDSDEKVRVYGIFAILSDLQ